MKVTGRCHCGAIRYEAEVDPAAVSLCNCTDCQRLSGTAWRVSVPSVPNSFRLLAGEPRRYVKTAESGNRRVQSFCGDCSSPVFASADEPSPAAFTLRVGCLDQAVDLAPTRQTWHRSMLPWSQDLTALPAVERK